MSILFAALLGLIQGVTEFLPISSSGHLSVLQNLFQMSGVGENHILFDTLLHLATIISICFVYWKDIVGMFNEVIGIIKDARHPKPDDEGPKPERRLALMIVIATLPLIVALPFANAVEKLYYNTFFIGIAFLITGAILYISDRILRGKKTAANMTVGNAFVIGLCQAVATLPGISRSGTTITAGMATGLDRSFAVKFSFLMSIPAVLGASLLNIYKAISEGAESVQVLPYLVGMIVAAVTGYFAIRLVKTLSQKGKFGKFCYYCFGVGILTIVLSFIF